MIHFQNIHLVLSFSQLKTKFIEVKKIVRFGRLSQCDSSVVPYKVEENTLKLMLRRSMNTFVFQIITFRGEVGDSREPEQSRDADEV